MQDVAKHHRIISLDNAHGEEEDWLAIDCAFIESGIRFAIENNRKRLLFGSLDNPVKANKVRLDILDRLERIEGLIWQIPIPKGSDGSPLERQAHLKYLSLGETDIALDLGRFPALEHLEFFQPSRVTGFERASKSLSSITVSRLATTLTFLAPVQGLKDLKIVRPVVESLTGIDGLKRLENLSLIRCAKLRDVSDAAHLPLLSRLSIDSAPLLTDLSALRRFDSLKNFWMKNKKIESCDFIRHMKKIEFSSINADIADGDLSPLLESPTLKEVWFHPVKKSYRPPMTPDDINAVLGRRNGE